MWQSEDQTTRRLKQKILKHLQFLETNRGELCDLLCLGWQQEPGRVSKDGKISEKARIEGNALFTQEKHDKYLHHKVLQLYNRSIAFAPHGSEELATAYGNKSALLRHVRKYAESIVELDKALKITESVTLKVKLLCRKADCYTALGSSQNGSCLKKAKFLSIKSNCSEKIKKEMMKLMSQTQSRIEANELDMPKENQRIVESIRIVAEAEKVDIWSCVKIAYNLKYGRHLAAARDFKPGEITLVEKPYVKSLDESKVYMYCYHCWNYLWTAFPCDNCSWRVFCSEKCKIEALKEYHDIECDPLIQMKENAFFGEECPIPFVVSGFMKALNEAGSISQLQEDSTYIDGFRGKKIEEIPPTRLSKNYNMIYSQPIRNFDADELKANIEIAVLTLMCLAKYSTVFGKTYDFDEIDNLMKNDCAIFSGALILRLYLLIATKTSSLYLIDPSKETLMDVKNSNRPRSVVSTPTFYTELFGSFTVSGCISNATHHLTYANRAITYSLSHIKKGSPIICSQACIYNLVPKAERQAVHKKIYRRPCDCQACSEDWSDILADVENLGKSWKAAPSIGRALMYKKEEIDKEIKAKYDRMNFPDPKLISKTIEFVTESWKHFPMPSLMTVRAVQRLEHVLGALHVSRSYDLERIPFCHT